ncbi:MAG TPA: serine/threonine-protein kinase [Longimicrobiaceae bacterium]|nr:serine/threonine-protein kinase [Longimicrobiaceae bacterium]
MSERWERVSALFAAARALDGAARESFLTIACAGDDALLAEVEALLASDVPDDGFLEDPPWAPLVRATGVSVGQVLKERYRVEAELAAGGQARVYQARDQVLGRSVVVKVMRAEGRGSRWLEARFEREMSALARVDHPGVVAILDRGELGDGSPFLVIQHVPGASLREVLSRGPLPAARVASLVRQMGSALGAVHAAGIAHGDLKPENVMLQPRGEGEIAKLIDFGIARIELADPAPYTTAAALAGTVRYMAPEQLEGQSSPASDVYALALVACEMLCGYPDLRAMPKSTGRGVRASLEAALTFHPGDRPTDARAWSERLAGALAAGERWRPRRVAAAAVLAAVVLTGAVAAEWTLLLDSAAPVRTVEKLGAFDPLEEGFQTHDDVRGTVAENPSRTGYDGWRISTRFQGYYFHPLTSAQKRRALARGWKLTAEMRADEGRADVGVDFAKADPRFDIDVLVDGDHEIVRLPTQLVPDMRGLELSQSPPGSYHRYELVYDPHLRSADLWIDGEPRLRGYQGLDQFPEDRGLTFGAGLYKSPHGSGSFRSVRFEINP